MRRFWPILLLILLAATPEETKLFRVAQSAFDDKLFDFAERQLKEFLKKFPASANADSAWLMLTQSQLRLGKWQDAVTSVDAGLEGRKPDEWPDGFRYWRAEALLQGEQFAAAEKGFAELNQRAPSGLYRPQAQFGLAFAQFKQGRYAEAAAALDDLAKMSQRERLILESLLLRGQIALALGQFEKADVAFAELAKREPDSRWAFRAHRWRAEMWARQKEWDKAVQAYALVLGSFKNAPNRPVDTQLAAEAWAGTGWVEFERGRFEEAVEAFSQAFTYARTASLRREALLKLSEAYVRAGKVAQGVARLKDFLRENPKDPIGENVQMAIGDLFFAREDCAAALPEYQQFIAAYPQSKLQAQANFNAGWCEVKLHKPGNALKYFQTAFDAAGTNAALAAEALFKLADTQFDLGQLQEAVASYQRLVSSYPQNKLVEGALYQIGHAFHRLQNPEGAIHVFESLLEQFPQGERAADAQLQIGLIHMSSGNAAQARAAFAEVVKKFPQAAQAAQAQLAVGESFYGEGKYDEAAAEYDQLITAAPDSELGQRAFYNRGWCWSAKGEVDRTLKEFTEFLATYPESSLAPDVEFWIAEYYGKKKDYVKAQEHYLAIHRAFPQSALADDALFFAGRAAYSRQDYKNAIELFETLMKTYTNSAFRCDARFGQADALTELGQFNDALIVFESLIKEFPDCYLKCETTGRKGDCLFILERYDDAITTYRVAQECDKQADAPFRNQIGYKIGQCFEKANKADDASEEYLKLLYETREWPDPSKPPECFWLGKAGLAAGAIKEQRQLWREAITIYQRLLELCPEMKDMLEDRIRKLKMEHFIFP